MTIADEIYERLTYATDHTSLAALPGMDTRTVTINGFSKSHSMTGYRVGYCAAPLDIAKACGKLQSQMTSCASSISQQAALAALPSSATEPDKHRDLETWLGERVQELQQKRDLAYRLIIAIPQVK